MLLKQPRCTFRNAVSCAAIVDLLQRTCVMAARGCITSTPPSIHLLPFSVSLLCCLLPSPHTIFMHKCIFMHTWGRDVCMALSDVQSDNSTHTSHPPKTDATHHPLSPHSIQLQSWSRPLDL